MRIVSKLDYTIDTTIKTTPWLAIEHARLVSDENEVLYTDKQKENAQRIKQYVESVFVGHRVFLNYRKKFIAVKVENISMAEASATQTQLLEDLCDLSNVEVYVHGTNVIFRVK